MSCSTGCGPAAPLRRLIGVLGASAALGDHLVAPPGRLAVLGSDAASDRRAGAALLAAVGADAGRPAHGDRGHARAGRPAEW